FCLALLALSASHLFQLCPFSFPGRCFLHQVQKASLGESVLDPLPFPFLLFPLEPEEERRAASAVDDGSIASRARRWRLQSVYDRSALVERLSTTFFCFLTRQERRASLLPLSLLSPLYRSCLY